jgi:hypothetical protein
VERVKTKNFHFRFNPPAGLQATRIILFQTYGARPVPTKRRSLPLPVSNPDNVSRDQALIVVQLWWSFRFACAGLETSEDAASSIGRRTLGTLVPPPRGVHDGLTGIRIPL